MIVFVVVCSNLMFAGDFQAVIAKKHTKNFELAVTLRIVGSYPTRW